MSAAGVCGSTTTFQVERRGSNPTAALQTMAVRPIPALVAREILVRKHYLHSFPGGTMLSFGVFLGQRLLGVLTFGAGPFLAYGLVKSATRDDCLCLTRLWLSDDLPSNSESRVLGVLLRALRRETNLKFLIAYSDPAYGHMGVIYQATGWLYTGLSTATPLYDLGDGIARHSRSLGQVYGSHSLRRFERHHVEVTLVTREPKHRYVRFLDESWQNRLAVPVLPYPKKEGKG